MKDILGGFPDEGPADSRTVEVDEQISDVAFWEEDFLLIPRKSSLTGKRLLGKAMVGVRQTWDGEKVMDANGNVHQYLAVTSHTLYLTKEQYLWLKLQGKAS